MLYLFLFHLLRQMTNMMVDDWLMEWVVNGEWICLNLDLVHGMMVIGMMGCYNKVLTIQFRIFHANSRWASGLLGIVVDQA